MKSKFLLLLLVGIASFSCKKNSPNNPTGPGGPSHQGCVNNMAVSMSLVLESGDGFVVQSTNVDDGGGTFILANSDGVEGTLINVGINNQNPSSSAANLNLQLNFPVFANQDYTVSLNEHSDNGIIFTQDVNNTFASSITYKGSDLTLRINHFTQLSPVSTSDYRMYQNFSGTLSGTFTATSVSTGEYLGAFEGTLSFCVTKD